ncbi:hypothetical protein [Pseudonocardia sp. NPDC049635]|uniref:hypothetical protein n=1 Tax=Pseudonocardia sp. NPDC049635 TaxID=3155506 RepID=UPI0033CD7E9C
MNIDTISKLNDYAQIPGRFQAAGLEVPEGFAWAVDAYRWTVDVPAMPVMDRIMTARTNQEFQKAAAEYVHAVEQHNAFAGPVAQEINRTRGSVLMNAFKQHKPELLETVIAAYDRQAQTVGPLLAGLPELRSANLFSLGVETATALVAAREEVDTLRTILGAYLAILSEREPKVPGESFLVRLAEFEDSRQLAEAARSVHQDGATAPVSPFLGLVTAGARLRLATPSDARDHLRQLQDAA